MVVELLVNVLRDDPTAVGCVDVPVGAVRQDHQDHHVASLVHSEIVKAKYNDCK